MANLFPEYTPWSGLLSLAGMMACLASAAIIVAVSHNNTITSWRVQPAVLLAIFSGASSILFASALHTGVAVRFWLSASNGTPLTQLHYIWDHGRGFGLIPALRAGSKARTVALLATAAYIMQFLASPLLQRSTYQAIRNEVSHETMSMDVATRIPDGWFGPRDAQNGGLLEFQNGLAELQHWWQKDPISTQDRTGYRCNGTCHSRVHGAGFRYECWTVQQQLDLSTPQTDNNTVFLVGLLVTQNGTDDPFLRLRTKYLSDVDSNCMGTIQAETCYLWPATVEYPITIQNTTASLRGNELLNMTVVSSYSSQGDLPDNASGGVPAGPLVSLRNFVFNIVTGNITKLYDADLNKTSYTGSGNLADIFFVPSDLNQDPSPSMCRLKFKPPTQYVLTVMYEFMFRWSLAAGKGNETQTFTAQRTASELVYQADPAFLAVSLGAMACGIVLGVALIWNWWLLGRPVSLSPLETAAALGRPILEDQPHATIDQILVEARDIPSEAPPLRRMTGNTSSGKLGRVNSDEKRVHVTETVE